MDAIKRMLILLFLLPTLTFGQESKYPKDTIYIKYENKRGIKKWNGKFPYKYEGKMGVYFNIEHVKGDMALFYEKELNIDTLSMNLLKEYYFSNLKEIRKKEIAWVDKKYAKSKYKPYTGGGLRNAAFQTYVIEVISKGKFVLYPVIWRNEGDID